MIADGFSISLQILEAYYTISEAFYGLPIFVKILISTPGWERAFIIPFKDLTIHKLEKICGPFLCIQSTKSRAALRDTLSCALLMLKEGTVRYGYYLDRPGAIRFPDGHVCFLRGSEILGSCNRPLLLSEPLRDMQLAGSGAQGSLSQLPSLLLSASLQVLLVLSYVILTSIRSLLIEEGLPLQAVLYIVGKQGLGKTTLAERIAAIYTKNGRPCGIVQAGSTLAASNDMITSLRDQPVIIDDVCNSAAPEVKREGLKLAAHLIRQGTGVTPIIKRSGKDTVQLSAEAGLIFTAEFPLENLSDLTRCIIVPLQEQPFIPDQLTPALIGDVIRFYSSWFCDHADEEIKHFRSAPVVRAAVKMDKRISNNYRFLQAAFGSFLRFLSDSVISCDENQLLMRLNDAMEYALWYQQGMIESLLEDVPVGNLAFCLYDGFENEAFGLAKKISKLEKHEGILWKGDLCLRAEPLVKFVRTQRGFHNWSPNKITRTLKDYGALVLQEENAATVHLTKGTPRVYRIRLDILKESAERF